MMCFFCRLPLLIAAVGLISASGGSGHAQTAAAGGQAGGGGTAGGEPPRSWIDPDTGHRVIRLTSEPNSASLYFNQHGYTADGKSLVYTTSDGISVLDLATRQARQVVNGRVRMIEAGRRTPRVYYVRGDVVSWTNMVTGETHAIGTLPRRGSVVTVNADETLLAGTYIEGDGQDYNNNRPAPTTPSVQAAAAARGAAAVGGAGGVETTGSGGATGAGAAGAGSAGAGGVAAGGAAAVGGTGAGAPAIQAHPLDQPSNKGQMMEQRWAARLPMGLFTMSVQTGEVKTIHRSRDWLNHLLFSPTDPTLLMFCHEGPWHKVDRIWTIRTDGTQIQKIHTRTMAMEIFGHEFWSADGKTIWYDLQTPRGEDFWLAAYKVETGERTWYHLQRDEWSIHFNVSRDGTLMCGDGGDPGQVAHARDGEWIYLFRPERLENKGTQDPHFVQTGVLNAERLVNMSKHRYRLEPNVSFTPDQQWIVFRSNMFGPTYVFAVEIAKATTTQQR